MHPSMDVSIWMCIHISYIILYIVSLYRFRYLSKSTWFYLSMCSSISLMSMCTRTMQDTYSSLPQIPWHSKSFKQCCQVPCNAYNFSTPWKNKVGNTQSIDLNPLWVAPLHQTQTLSWILTPKTQVPYLFFGQTCFQKQGRRPVDGRQRYIDVDTAWMVSIGHLNCSCVITSKDQRFGRGFYGILVILVHIKYDWNY